MGKNSLDKEILDKVREIDGFPIGNDEDIINLSDPPHYTACPNPWIEDFIKEHGNPYDRKNDDYLREPFTSDVSEGKNDPLYNAHAYHTKVPHQVIMQFLMHYSKPNDLIYDGFCGSGMTGVASILCGFPNTQFKQEIESKNQKVEWGIRKAILCDLSPFATFISHNFNSPIPKNFLQIAEHILEQVKDECGWMYQTHHTINEQIQYKEDVNGIKKPIFGRINHVIWSDVFVCPNCTTELVFWDLIIGENNANEEFSCINCKIKLTKRAMNKAWVTRHDDALNQNIKQVKQVPRLINYNVTIGKKTKRLNKKPDQFDLDLIKKIEGLKIKKWYPNNSLPIGYNTKHAIINI